MDWLKKKKKKQRLVQGRERGAKLLEDLIECCDGKSNPIKFFSADQIIKATNNFGDSNRISELKYRASKWYSGKINNHHMIFLRGYTERDFCRDISISSMVSGHKNFMKLLGCCLEFEEPIIVYNFIKISGLYLEMVVSWKRRIKIAEDIATALAYLHTAFPRPFIYRAMDPWNIFLDEDGVARLCDFSYCISIPQGETFVKVDRVMVRLGFMDDKYLSTGTVSEKTDVFAIGILMQKLLFGNMSGMVPWWLSKSMEELRMDEIADPKMLRKMDKIGEEELLPNESFPKTLTEMHWSEGGSSKYGGGGQGTEEDTKTFLLLLLPVKPKSTLPKTFLPQSFSQDPDHTLNTKA